ncbi:NUMOD4 domain-containing protein [Chryseobacterium sp. MHB01]|uniref:NUMOD4 domain-containing protein n=1 Tax=Chryseobacterium sp. MHB01 TaxID=3109433 RepID=UPI002AFE5445|nr:NUMOD4 domain-containing protein [Chryseobacterium sp. MHB01]MEA1848968.1 NUMOD4 domain-containing protein [Chryseobacterium sp. MHB01]
MMENEVGLNQSLQDLPGEEWKIIPGFENRYYISNYSRILDTHKGDRILHKYDYGNRLVVRLNDRRGRSHYFTDYILTANIFLQNDEENKKVYLKDCNYKNGHVSNLYFGKRIVNNPKAKLDLEKILKIREYRDQGLKLEEIALAFNVSKSCVHYNVKCRAI